MKRYIAFFLKPLLTYRSQKKSHKMVVITKGERKVVNFVFTHYKPQYNFRVLFYVRGTDVPLDFVYPHAKWFSLFPSDTWPVVLQLLLRRDHCDLDNLS